MKRRNVDDEPESAPLDAGGDDELLNARSLERSTKRRRRAKRKEPAEPSTDQQPSSPRNSPRDGWRKFAVPTAVAGVVVAVLYAAFAPVRGLFSNYDDQDIPYDLTGFVVWFHRSRSDSKPVRLAELPAFYETRSDGRANCQNLARQEERRLSSLCAEYDYDDEDDDEDDENKKPPECVGFNPHDWSYVCCTVTPKTDCMTEVR